MVCGSYKMLRCLYYCNLRRLVSPGLMSLYTVPLVLIIHYHISLYPNLFSFLCSACPGHWDSMEEYTCMIPRDTHDGAFYRAVLALHQDLFSLAQQVGCIITPFKDVLFHSAYISPMFPLETTTAHTELLLLIGWYVCIRSDLIFLFCNAVSKYSGTYCHAKSFQLEHAKPVPLLSACQQTLVEVMLPFSHLMDAGDLGWAHGPWRHICSSWMPACLVNTHWLL